ncbi:MAG: glycerol kinase [Myxococcaceae bacterium]|nr:glycerol kinase [Myxococcaceae bacterium]MBH2006744.1 glycerol kinase [Myxococcaceae bacterium]
MQFVLSIDQGTTGTTSVIADSNLRIVARQNVPFDQIFPKAGWVEHREEDVWNSVRCSVQRSLEQSGLKPSQIGAIGITNQRETTAIFDQNGTLQHPLIVWQCRRSLDICTELKNRGLEPRIREKTGLLLDPYFSGTKLTWLFRQYPSLRRFLFGTVDTWLLYKLSAGAVHATDATNASRTLLMNLKTCNWDPELCEMLEVPEAILPEIRSSQEVYAHTRGLDFLPDGIPIASLIGDQQSALYGLGCLKKGQAKATYGTGCFILLHTGTKPVASKHNLLTSIALKTQSETTYCLEASAFIAGAAIQWLRDGLGLIQEADELETLAKQVSDSSDLVFIPALTGLAAPYWKPEARGLFYGIGRDTKRAHFARAALEGIALLNQDMLQAMVEDSGTPIQFLRVDGGAASNDLLIQMQADLSNLTCLRSSFLDTTALGALLLAGQATGILQDSCFAQKFLENTTSFSPLLSEENRARLARKWAHAMGLLIRH